jgi:hypothetical protein
MAGVMTPRKLYKHIKKQHPRQLDAMDADDSAADSDNSFEYDAASSSSDDDSDPDTVQDAHPSRTFGSPAQLGRRRSDRQKVKQDMLAASNALQQQQRRSTTRRTRSQRNHVAS